MNEKDDALNWRRSACRLHGVNGESCALCAFSATEWPVSPDRTRIVIASLYGATAADTATGLATNRLWSLDTAGQGFVRLTPVFPNTHPGQTGWNIDVRDPAYSANGQVIVFDYGEGDFQGGYVAPWLTAAVGSTR